MRERWAKGNCWIDSPHHFVSGEWTSSLFSSSFPSSSGVSVCEDFCWATPCGIPWPRRLTCSSRTKGTFDCHFTLLPRCRYHLVVLIRTSRTFGHCLIKTFPARSTTAASQHRPANRMEMPLLSHINCLHADKQWNSCMKCLHFSNPHGAVVGRRVVRGFSAIESHYCSFIADE